MPAADGPLNACPWPGCTKAYKRLDHLERHQKSHSGDLEYRCYRCHKQYSRSDVLNRHLVQTHGEKAARAGRPRRAACIACVDRRVACDGIPPRVCSRCRDLRLQCRYRHLEIEAQSSGRASASPVASTAAAPVTQAVGHHGSGSREASLLGVVRPTGQSPFVTPLGLPAHAATEGVPFAPHLSLPGPWQEPPAPPPMPPRPAEASLDLSSPNWLTELILSATMQDQGSSQPNPQPQAASTFDWGFTEAETAFDWGFAEPDPNIFVPLGSRPSSPSPSRDADLIVAAFPEEVDGQADPRRLPDGHPTDGWLAGRSPSPDPQVQLPEPGPDTDAGMAPPSLASGRSVKPHARAMMLSLATHSHRASWPAPDLRNFPSETTLTACVNLYLAHFAKWLPVLDWPYGSFLMDKAAPLLLKATAAVGSVYARDGSKRLGPSLAELVRREIFFMCEHDQRFTYELSVVQANLLQAYFSLFSGSPRLLRLAEVARGWLVASCRRMDLLNSAVSIVDQVFASKGTEEQLARALKLDHRRKRAGWSIYLLDSQLACLFNTTPLLPFHYIACPLPTVEPNISPHQASFAQTISKLLSDGALDPHLDDIGLSCIAYALYRICLDAESQRTFVFSPPTGNRYTLATPYTIHPQAMLDHLASQALRLPAPSALLVSCATLAYHAHLAFTSPGLLENVKQAAGRSGDARSRDAARSALRVWIAERPAQARNVFAHAAMLYCLLCRFSFDTPPEGAWMFDAVLCMWMWLRLTNAPPEGRGRPVVITHVASLEVDEWIASGQGIVSVHSLGGQGLSASRVLELGADRLAMMPWGLAARYRSVLLGLAAAEDRYEVM